MAQAPRDQNRVTAIGGKGDSTGAFVPGNIDETTGNFIVDVNDISRGTQTSDIVIRLNDGQTGRQARINPGSGALSVDQTIRLIGPQFVGSTIDDNFWTLANNGTASGGALANGLVTLTSGTDNSGSGSLTSVQHARFLFVNPNEFRMITRVTDTTVADCTRRWGAIDVTAGTPWTLNNGFYFSLDGAGALSVNYKTAGTGATSVASGAFNGDVTTYTVDTNAHAYEILYFEAKIWFVIDTVLIHSVPATTAKLTNDFNLHIGAESVNSGSGTTSGVLEVFASSILRIGSPSTVPICSNITTNSTNILKRSSGRLHRITVNDFGNANTITVYDNSAASGVIMATIGSTNEGPFEFDCEFQTGLTIVQSGGTASDITVVYD